MSEAAPSVLEAGETRSFLRAVASHGMPGGPELAREVTDPMVASALVTEVQQVRLTGPFAAAVRSGRITLPDETAERLLDLHRQALVWCLNLEQRLLEVESLLSLAGVPTVVLKGPAVAHLDAADPGERTWSDVDLLVRPDHIERAVAEIMRSGVVRDFPEHRPGWDRRFGKAIGLSADGIEVDVHRTLVDGVYGARIPIDRLHSSAVELRLGGRTLRALSDPARVLHMAYHAVVGSSTPSWSNLRDLARYFTSQEIPLDDVVAEAALWRGEAVLWTAVRLVRSELGVDAPDWYRWADSVEPPPREQRMVSRVRHGDAGLARVRLDLLSELNWVDRAAYLRALAFPVGAPEPVWARYRRWVPQLVRRLGR